MKQFVSHIDFLIQKHDCVIIPDFGGFVLSHEAASVTNDGSILPPRIVVGFNPELKYNDGLLAESYMNVYSISYDTACKRIMDVVSRLNTILSLRQPVRIGNLGQLRLSSDGHLCFTSDANLTFCYAENYGLSKLNISRLRDIPEIPKVTVFVTKKRISYQRIFTGIGAAAAAVLIFFMTSTPVFDPKIENSQMASFFADITSSSVKESVNNENNVNRIESVVETILVDDKISESSNSENLKVETNFDIVPVTKQNSKIASPDQKYIKNTPIYYVIVGSTNNKSDAKNILRKIKNQGYANADIVVSSDRSRIYVASFENKSQAESYLSKLKRDNSQFSDSWLYTKRN